MASKLIPLKDIPYAARQTEARARTAAGSRDAALEAATYRIVEAAGCYSGAFPGTIGWVVTLTAAEALAGVMTRMPGNSMHHRMDYQVG